MPVELLTTVPDDDLQLIRRLERKLNAKQRFCASMDAYYEGEQRLEHIGLAVPPELRRFETVINIPRMAVDEPERRLDVRALVRPGEEKPDTGLMDLWLGNNMDSQAPLLHKDTGIYGHGFTTVGANEENKDLPLIRVEPTDAMTCIIDERHRRIRHAWRRYKDESGRITAGTLYSPNRTLWVERVKGRWKFEDADDHDLGRVPVILHLNRARTGRWNGTSEMKDVIGLTDAIARTITNMQIAAETSAIPQKYVVGASQGDFVDQNGKPLTVWESYFSGVWALKNPAAKAGTFTPASLSNFHEQVDSMFAWCAAILGLPTRYAGQQTVNPSSEGAIRADEARLIKNAERKQTTLGDSHGWTLALASELAGDPIDGNRVGVLWHNAATPTVAERSDAIVKLTGGKPILSREGGWDELGWGEDRKNRERGYFADEAEDPVLERLGRDLDPAYSGN